MFAQLLSCHKTWNPKSKNLDPKLKFQIVVDTTIVSFLRRDGEPRPGADAEPGVGQAGRGTGLSGGEGKGKEEECAGIRKEGNGDAN